MSYCALWLLQEWSSYIFHPKPCDNSDYHISFVSCVTPSHNFRIYSSTYNLLNNKNVCVIYEFTCRIRNEKLNQKYDFCCRPILIAELEHQCRFVYAGLPQKELHLPIKKSRASVTSQTSQCINDFCTICINGKCSTTGVPPINTNSQQSSNTLTCINNVCTTTSCLNGVCTTSTFNRPWNFLIKVLWLQCY